MARISGDVRIVLLGKTGSGKSATGNTIQGRNVFIEELSLESVTKVCMKEETNKDRRRILIIDTPGLQDTSNETQTRKEIEKCMKMSTPGPHVFLLVIRLAVRLTDEEKNTVKWIQMKFGEEALRHTCILFTHVDQLRSPLNDYIEESPELQQLIIQCYGRYHSVNNSNRGNQAQVTELLEKIDTMVIQNGGKYYTAKMYEQAPERWSRIKCIAVVSICGIGIILLLKKKCTKCI